MPRRASHLQLRGNVYWLRLRVPDALRPYVGKVEIKKSLKTSDYREAQLRGRIERVKIDAEWETLRRRLSPVTVTELSERETWQLFTQWFVDFEKRNVEKSDRWASLEDAERDLADLSDAGNLAIASFREAEQVVATAGLKLEPGSDGWMRLDGYIRQGLIEAARREIARSFPAVALPTDPQLAGLNASTKLQPVAKITVKRLIAHVRSDTTRSPMSKKTALKRTAQWQAITEFFGADTDITEIGRPRVREFIDLLQKLPSNATKHFPNATIFEAAQMAAEKKLPVLATETANDYLRTLGTLFRAAVREEWLAKDPSEGLLIQAKIKIRAKDKRLPFSNEDLKAIFSAPLYTGCKDDEAGYNVEGTKIVRRGRFWAPLMALYTGMRLNEVCQLTLDDFEVQDDTDIILIRGSEDGETKRVKTAAGHRFVPVHPELKRMGLLTFVADQRLKREPDASLFAELPLGTTGYRSDPFSKFFARFLDKVGITDPKKVFHSFRHNYRDALREADISIEKVRALGGWTTGNTEDDYGKGLRPSTLATAIKAVAYPGLDLSHLYTSDEVSPS
ncbi:site-specific integrase [Mesorhizobium sp. WSM4884]|uniref:site-specific integrase n=1 Tax=Mesorhizobium sp. WSM4884 TaxID=3038542 RepID=UPI0032420A97